MLSKNLNPKAIHFVLLSVCFVLLGVNAVAQKTQSHPKQKPRLFGSFDVKDDEKKRLRIVEKTPAETKTDKPSVEKKPVAFVLSSEEQRLLNNINQKRAAQGFSPLAVDAQLCRLAKLHSENMIKQKFFSHITPDGKNVQDRARDLGITNFKAIGENLAFNQGYEDPIGFAVERWLLSTGHKQNIFQSVWTATGIGIAKNEEGGYFFTQVFMVR